MTGPSEQIRFPRAPLYAVFGLVFVAVAVVLFARATDIGTTRLQYAAPAETRDLRFEDRSDGSVAVHDATDGSVIDVVAPGTKGFIRTVMRGLAHSRVERGFGPEGSFRLTRWDDGRLSISDPLTGRQVQLVGFGTSNAEVFANLLPSGRSSP